MTISSCHASEAAQQTPLSYFKNPIFMKIYIAPPSPLNNAARHGQPAWQAHHTGLNSIKPSRSYKHKALVASTLSALLSVTGVVETVLATPYSPEGKFYRADKPITDKYG